MKQVADWLEKLGMSEYVERFAENDVDFTLLPELTDQDLEKIGIASLGHRRKILRAIAALYSTPTAAKPTVPAQKLSPLRQSLQLRGRRGSPQQVLWASVAILQ
jgi:hypothetical protein